MDSLKFSSSFWSAGIPPGQTFTAAMFIVSLFLIFLRHIYCRHWKEVKSIWETFSKEHPLSDAAVKWHRWKKPWPTSAFGSSRRSTCLIYSIQFPCCGQVISSYCFPTVALLHEWFEVFFSWNYILNRSSACHKKQQKTYPCCKDRKEKKKLKSLG